MLHNAIAVLARLFSLIPIFSWIAIAIYYGYFWFQIGYRGYTGIKGGIGRLKGNCVGIAVKSSPALIAYSTVYAVAIAKPCIEIDGVMYMDTDYTIVCDDVHSGYQTRAVVMMLFYFSFLIATYFWFRHHLHSTVSHEPSDTDIDWLVGLSSLKDVFVKEFWFWRYIEILQLLSLTAMIQFIGAGSSIQVFVGILLSGFWESKDLQDVPQPNNVLTSPTPPPSCDLS